MTGKKTWCQHLKCVLGYGLWTRALYRTSLG
jgi:hypothetical protein